MDQFPLLPLPSNVIDGSGSFVFPSDVTVSCDEPLTSEAELLIERLGAVLPRPAGVVNAAQATTIQLKHRPQGGGREAYQLNVTPAGITLTAAGPAGIFYGCQTLAQLIEQTAQQPGEIRLPAVTIDDEPRFGWRGLMLDVARHFFTADEVCRFIERMARYKLNTFHWHLTDDQGWRFPVKRYPRLTEVGSKRPYTLIGHNESRPRHYDDQPYWGHYTPEDIRRVVEFAAKRHITVVPEIDMPGHMQAAIAAYPELGNLPCAVGVRPHWGISQHILNPKPATIDFMKNVLDELIDLFPGPFIHIGGDEALTHEWGESRTAQDRMIELGLKNEHELQGWFIRQMGDHIASRGRRMIGWDEIGENELSPGTAIMSWRGTQAGADAAAKGHDVVMSPHTHVYFDHHHRGPEGEPLAIGGMTTLEKVYSFEPIPDNLDPAHHRHILGAQGNVWTEYVPSESHLHYMAFPRAIALAEVLWTKRAARRWEDFAGRVSMHEKLR